MIQVLIDFFTFLYQNPFSGILAIVYFALAFGDREGRETFFNRTWYLVTSPQKFDTYNEDWFRSVEDTMQRLFLRDFLLRSIEFLRLQLANAIVYWKKLIGWLFLSALLIIFILADIYTIKDVAASLGFPLSIPIFDAFDYGFAITAGTFFTIITAGVVLFEVTGNGEFSDYGTPAYENLRKLFKSTAIFLLISSLLIILFFGLRAFSISTALPESMSLVINNLAQFGGNVLVRVNALIATALIITESIKALQSLSVLAALLALIVLSVIYLISGIISTLVRLLLDLVFRIAVWFFWLITFLIFAPLDKLISVPARLSDLFFPKNKS